MHKGICMLNVYASQIENAHGVIGLLHLRVERLERGNIEAVRLRGCASAGGMKSKVRYILIIFFRITNTRI